jgi:hypothetical protein
MAPRRVCIPGFFCVENLTIILMFVLLFVVTFLLYQQSKTYPRDTYPRDTYPRHDVILLPPPEYSSGLVTLNSSAESLTIPPLNVQPSLPLLNISSQGKTPTFSQVGIMTRGDDDATILPLMGRRMGRGKYNYYTMSTNSTINSKLPVRINGRSGTAEYGIDEVSSGDVVSVDGYKDKFQVTLYDNAMFQYV